MNPNRLVEKSGEELTLTRVVDFETGMDGVSGVQREVLTFKGIVSNPSEEQEQRLEGRLETGAITITVDSDLDIEANRDGGRDRVIRPNTDDVETEIDGSIYTVIDVTRDRHPIVGVEKTTVVCNVLDRVDLVNDAEVES